MAADVEARASVDRSFRAVALYCPACSAILGVQIEPTPIKAPGVIEETNGQAAREGAASE